MKVTLSNFIMFTFELCKLVEENNKNKNCEISMPNQVIDLYRSSVLSAYPLRSNECEVLLSYIPGPVKDITKIYFSKKKENTRMCCCCYC